MKKFGIKPIMGCELYISKDASIKNKENKSLSHLVVLAKNYFSSNRVSCYMYIDWRHKNTYLQAFIIKKLRFKNFFNKILINQSLNWITVIKIS